MGCAPLHKLSAILGAVLMTEKLTEAEWRELTGLIKAASPERIQAVLAQIGVKAGGPPSVVNAEADREDHGHAADHTRVVGLAVLSRAARGAATERGLTPV
jgi:hypothetical protein